MTSPDDAVGRPRRTPPIEGGELHRLLVESVRDYAIFVLDPQGHVASWNEGAQRIKGYTAEEIVGRHFSVFYPEDRVAERFPQYELEVAGRERPGRGRDVHVRAAAARAPA